MCLLSLECSWIINFFFFLFIFVPLLFSLSPEHFSPLFVLLNCLVLCFLRTAAIYFIHTSKTKESWFHPKSFKHFDGCLISNAECATASYTPNMSKILPLPIEITVTHPCIDEKPRLCHITLQETAVFAISSQFWILEVKISCAASFVFFFSNILSGTQDCFSVLAIWFCPDRWWHVHGTRKNVSLLTIHNQ